MLCVVCVAVWGLTPVTVRGQPYSEQWLGSEWQGCAQASPSQPELVRATSLLT